MLKKITAFLNHKQKNPETEQKGFSPYQSLLLGPLGTGFGYGINSLVWMNYYGTAVPMGDAIDKIADECAKIKLILFAPDTNEAELPVTNHPFLKLLQNPNPYQTNADFTKEGITHERVTGNQYMYFTGCLNAAADRIVSDPIEVYNLRPDLMTLGPDPRDGRALYYQYTMASGKMMTFKRAEIRDRAGRLCEAYVESNGFGILYHFKNISTRRLGGYYQLLGDPPLQSAQIQIAQYLQAAEYNYMLLNNGLSAKNIVSIDTKEPPTQQQTQALKRFVEDEFSGSGNAGKSMVASVPLKVDSLSINIKDMDFKSLDTRTTETIYRKLNIPLPMISADHTALSNMETSYLMFYDCAVLPVLNRYCDRMFTFPFSQCYKDADQFLKFGYNESSIGALQPRMADIVKKLKESGVATINELREYQGLSRIDSEGADDVYIANNVVSVGTDTNLIDTVGIDQQKPKKAMKGLEESLRKTLKMDGTPLYSEEEITALLLYPEVLRL